MRTLRLWKVLLSLVFLLSQAGVYQSAAADSPTVGRNFRFVTTDSDNIVVTLSEDLPVTSADVYFDIVIDGSFYGWDVVEGQRVYPLSGAFLPDSTQPIEIRLGIYGTVNLNGVDLNTIDGDVLAGINFVDMVLISPNSSGAMSVQGYAFADPNILDGRWATIEFIPTNFNGMSQADIAAVTAAFAALRQPEIIYGDSVFEQHWLTLPCSAGSFALSTKLSLGPDHSILGAPKVISCDRLPEIRVALTGTGALIADGGAFTFPSTPVSSLPVSQQFNLCNDGSASLSIANPTALVSGGGFAQSGSAPAISVAPMSCTNFRVDFNATSPGAYSGAITINNNDADENPYNIALSGTALAAGPSIHVQSQTVTRQGSLTVRARDQVLVTNQNNQPVSGVLVTLSFSGPSSGTVSGTTGSDGRVTLQTGTVFRPSGQWCFTVVSLSKTGYTYNAAANVVTTKCG